MARAPAKHAGQRPPALRPEVDAQMHVVLEYEIKVSSLPTLMSAKRTLALEGTTARGRRGLSEEGVGWGCGKVGDDRSPGSVGALYISVP